MLESSKHMLVSTIITELRREAGDLGKSTKATRASDGTSTLFNLGNFPILEGSYAIYVNDVLKTETTDYTLDKDNGDLVLSTAPTSWQEVRAEYKYVNWRDQNWLQAIKEAVQMLNARGFFRQVVRNKTIMEISANVTEYSGPSACVDIYEVLESDNYTVSGTFKKIGVNWSYQQDANKLVVGNKPSVANKLAISYLRNLQEPTSTSVTIDVLDDWITIIKQRAKSSYYQSLAAKIAQEGNANIDEGHFSFTNVRTLSRDLNEDFEKLALRKKPTRPAKDMQWQMDTGGVS